MQHNFFAELAEAKVARINANETHEFLLKIHYAKRLPSISYAFGLYRDGILAGVITYGRPPASTQRTGVCGEEYADYVYELNRLCLLDNKKNEASQLIAESFKLLEKPAILLSYADPEQGHVGYVYQATNWLYTGLTEKRSEWKIRGMEHLHSHTIADKFKEFDKPSQAIREAHGDDFYLKDRPRKHRYVIFLGDRRFRKRARAALRYEITDYPKEITNDS